MILNFINQCYSGAVHEIAAPSDKKNLSYTDVWGITKTFYKDIWGITNTFYKDIWGITNKFYIDIWGITNTFYKEIWGITNTLYKDITFEEWHVSKYTNLLLSVSAISYIFNWDKFILK